MTAPARRGKGKRSSMGSIPWHSERPRPNKPPKSSLPNTAHRPDRPERPGRHGRPGKPHRLRPNRPHLNRPHPNRPHSNRPHSRPHSHAHSSRPSSASSSRPPKAPALTRPHPDRPSRPISEGPSVSSSRPSTSHSSPRPPSRHNSHRPKHNSKPHPSHVTHSNGSYHSYPTRPTTSRPPTSRPPNKRPSSLDHHVPLTKLHDQDSSTYASNAPSTTSYLPTSNLTSSTSSRPRGYPKPLPRGNGFPVIAHGNFLFNRPSSFTFEPLPKPSSYSIRTRGANRFRIVPKPASLHATRTLIDDYTGVPVPLVRMHHHMFSARGAVTISAVGGGPLMVLQRSSVVRVGKRVLHGYVRGRSGKPDVVIETGDGGREFILRDRRSNEVARVYRNRVSRRGTRPKRYAYKIVVQPGYDTLLFVMCIVCMHEMWDDTQ